MKTLDRLTAASCTSSEIGYKTGDVIAAADPFSHILKPEFRGKRCDNCYQSG